MKTGVIESLVVLVIFVELFAGTLFYFFPIRIEMKGIYEDFVIDSKNIFYELLCGVGVLIGLILCYAFKFVDPRAYVGGFIIAVSFFYLIKIV
jgi:hypothetical protein